MTASVSPEVIEKWASEFELVYAIPEFIIRKGVDYSHRHGFKSDISVSFTEKLGAWITARQSAVIELPPKSLPQFQDIYTSGYNDALKACQMVIENQGYQVNFNQPTQG